MTLQSRVVATGLAILASSFNAHAVDWSGMLRGAIEAPRTNEQISTDLSETEMVAGLKEALAVGVERAVNGLGRPGGYLNDAAVRIPLPGLLEKTELSLRMLGQGKAVDEFIATINVAAERAVPQAARIVGEAVRAMTIADAQNLLTGADDAATQYFRAATSDQIAAAMRPIVEDATEKAGVTRAYRDLVARAGPAASLLGGGLDLDAHVTEKTLEGLFLKLAEEERAIRANPLARSSAVLQKVFGAAAR